MFLKLQTLAACQKGLEKQKLSDQLRKSVEKGLNVTVHVLKF